MNDPSYNLNLTPITLDNYSFGEIKLDDFQLSNLNLIISKLAGSKEISFNDSFGMEWEVSFVGLIDYLFHTIGDQGPFLIISGNYQKWADIISNIEGIVPLIYRGSPQERKLIRSKQMFNPDNSLQFNVLISTSELSEVDYSSINEVYYHLTIFHNFRTVKYMPKSNKMIRYTQEYSKAFLSDLVEIGNFTNKSYYEDSNLERKQEKIENFENLLTFIQSEPVLTPPQYFYIDCPLCEIQKIVLKKLICQSEQNFSSLCQKIMRVCSHPFLVFGIESLLGDVDYIQSSTKFHVFTKLITEKLVDARKILVITQFNGMLDLIEDFCTEKNISYDRLIDPEFDYENTDNKLLLYNPLYDQIQIVTEFIDYFIIIDGDHSSLLDTLLKNPTRKLKGIYMLQCQELFETRITKICMHGLNTNFKANSTNGTSSAGGSPYLSSKSRGSSLSPHINSLHFQYAYIYSDSSNYDFSRIQYEEFMSELLCKIAAAASITPVRKMAVDSIVSDVSKEPIETGSIFDIQFCQSLNFWDVLKETSEFQTKTEFPLVAPVVEKGKHTWTLRERDQLIRGLISFGWDRWNDIIQNGGLQRVSKEDIIQASRSYLRFLLRFSSSPFPLIRQFIRECSNGDQNSSFINDEKADQMFMEKEPVFSQSKFKIKMKSNADFYLKRIESLSYLSHTVEAYIGNISSLPISRTIGNSPTLTWTGTHDRILLLGSYHYGFASYDHFPEDQDLTYREVSYCAEQKLLNERLLKLTENLKRMHDAGFQPTHKNYSESENSDNSDEGYKENVNLNLNSRKVKIASSDDDNDEGDDINGHSNLSCHWSREEKSQIFKFMLENGVINDFEAMRKESHLENKTAEQVKEYVDDYLERCKVKPEEGGVKLKTANKIKRRVQAMDELRAVLNYELQTNHVLYRFKNSQPSRKPKQKSDDGDYGTESSITKSNEADGKKIFENVPHWKKFPPSWNPSVERYFFAQLAIKGFNAIDEILQSCEKRKLVDIKALPTFVTKFDSIFKRIHAIYEVLVQKCPSVAQNQNRQNPHFYRYCQNQLQEELKEKQATTSKIKLKFTPNLNQQVSDQISIENQENVEISQAEAPAPEEQQPVHEVKDEEIVDKHPQVKITVKKPVKKASNISSENDENSVKKSSDYSENESSEYDAESDNSDEYKSRITKTTQPRRSQNRPLATKDELKESHKEQVKQAQAKIKSVKLANFQQKLQPAVTTKFTIDDFTFPFTITSTSSVLNIGEIVFDRPAFHSERYIYPAGYKSLKVYASIDNPEARANYISEIIDNGSEAPLFRVTMEGTDHVFEGSTPTAPWTNVLKEVFSQGKRRNYSVSGPEAFMIAQPKVMCLIQMLPNAEKCEKYVHKPVPQSVLNELSKVARKPDQKKESETTDGAADEVKNEDDVGNSADASSVGVVDAVVSTEVVPAAAEVEAAVADEEERGEVVEEVAALAEAPGARRAISKASPQKRKRRRYGRQSESESSDDDDEDDGDYGDEEYASSRARGGRRQKQRAGEASPKRKAALGEDESDDSDDSDDEDSDYGKAARRARTSPRAKPRARNSEENLPRKVAHKEGEAAGGGEDDGYEKPAAPMANAPRKTALKIEVKEEEAGAGEEGGGTKPRMVLKFSLKSDSLEELGASRMAARSGKRRVNYNTDESSASGEGEGDDGSDASYETREAKRGRTRSGADSEDESDDTDPGFGERPNIRSKSHAKSRTQSRSRARIKAGRSSYNVDDEDDVEAAGMRAPQSPLKEDDSNRHEDDDSDDDNDSDDGDFGVEKRRKAKPSPKKNLNRNKVTSPHHRQSSRPVHKNDDDDDNNGYDDDLTDSSYGGRQARSLPASRAGAASGESPEKVTKTVKVKVKVKSDERGSYSGSSAGTENDDEFQSDDESDSFDSDYYGRGRKSGKRRKKK